MAKVSIVMSVYNKEPWLEKCLDSLISQTFSDIEIVLVDNGSTDNSANIIKKYMSGDDRIRLITLENNIGPAGGESVGVDHVAADYFTLCDADDYVDPNFIEALYQEMISENADIVMCTNDYVYSDGTCRINKRPNTDRIVFSGGEIGKLLPQLLDHHSNEYLGYYLAEIGAAWAKLYRTSLVKGEKINYEKDGWIWSDWLFNFRVLKKAAKFVYTERTTYHNYMSENSTLRSPKFNRNRFDEMEYILKRFTEECMDIDDAGGELYQAKSRFLAGVIFSLVGYYSKFYKTDLNIMDEVFYLKRVCALEATKKMDVGLRGSGIPFYKIRSSLLKHRIYIAEIVYIMLRSR